MFFSSKNGSPVEPVDDGVLVATVVKKLRSNDVEPKVGASFGIDINLGAGRHITLIDDTKECSNLDPEARTTTVETLVSLYVLSCVTPPSFSLVANSSILLIDRHDQVANLLQQLQK